MKIFCTLGGAGLFALSLTASALSLGQSQGQVVLGAPLDLVFQLQTDAGSDVAASCVGAELLLGERRVDSARVQVTPLPARAEHLAAVRVHSSALIDEPIVVVQLSAGCQGRISRNYTFFAELPAAAPSSVTTFASGQLSSARAVGAAVVGDSSLQPPRRAEPRRTPPAQAQAPAARERQVSAAPVKASPPQRKGPAPASQAQTAAVAEPAAKAESRLRMEPLETWLDPNASGGAAQNSEAKPADAAVLALAQERVKVLEAEMRTLKSREASQTASLAQMRSELEALQARPADSFWTLPLLAALAIALAVLGGLLLRLRRLARAPKQLWQQPVDASLRAADAPQAAAVAAATEGGFDALVAAPWPDAAKPQAAQAHDARSSLPSLAAASASAAPRVRDVVKPEELFDVRQQAEFFTSVGEYEQAIAVMRKHIAEHQDSSPLAYLELLGLFYQLSRQTEFNALRQQFEQYFAVKVPGMAQFAQRGRSLEEYPELLSSIQAMWTNDQIGELLESYLFRRGDSGVLFDLEAFDDLLLLQAVARSKSAGVRAQTSAAQDAKAHFAENPVGAEPTASALGSLTLADEPWAALERATAAEDKFAPSLPVLMEEPLSLAQNSLLLEIPAHFDVPQGAFARSQPLPAEPAAADLQAASPLLDIDLSDVGRWAPLDLPTVEPLPFAAQEFSERGDSAGEQNPSVNARDSQSPDEWELTPWEEDASENMFSALNAQRTERLVSTPPAEDIVFPDEAAPGKKPKP